MASFNSRRDVQHVRGIVEGSGNLLFRELGERFYDRINSVTGRNVSQYIRYANACALDARGAEAYVAICSNAFAHDGIVQLSRTRHKSKHKSP